MGTAVYVSPAQIKSLAYKTTLLSARWDLGDGGIRIFGALWVLPTIGFIAVAACAGLFWLAAYANEGPIWTAEAKGRDQFYVSAPCWPIEDRFTPGSFGWGRDKRYFILRARSLNPADAGQAFFSCQQPPLGA
jgi:hypothetical protein